MKYYSLAPPTIRNGATMLATNLRLAVLCLLVILVSACNQDSSLSSNTSPEDFAGELMEAWDSHDIDKILSFYADDAFYEDVPNVVNGWATPMRGHQQIRKTAFVENIRSPGTIPGTVMQ